jgi:hypothetical protein
MNADAEDEDYAGVECFWKCIGYAARLDDPQSEERQLAILERLWHGEPFDVRRQEKDKVILPILRK